MFFRKNYLLHFKHISAPTDSRNLQKGLLGGFILSSGEKNQTIFWFK
jgi:hypothetical protein